MVASISDFEVVTENVPSQWLWDVLPFSEKNYGEQSADSREQGQENSLAIFRDCIWIIFHQIVGELSNESIPELDLTEWRMYEALAPVLQRRKAELWALLRTPRALLSRTRTIIKLQVDWRKKVKPATCMSHLSQVDIIRLLHSRTFAEPGLREAPETF